MKSTIRKLKQVSWTMDKKPDLSKVVIKTQDELFWEKTLREAKGNLANAKEQIILLEGIIEISEKRLKSFEKK